MNAPGPEVDGGPGRVDPAGGEVQDQEEQDGQVELPGYWCVELPGYWCRSVADRSMMSPTPRRLVTGP
jgi:hypothetical protein